MNYNVKSMYQIEKRKNATTSFCVLWNGWFTLINIANAILFLFGHKFVMLIDVSYVLKCHALFDAFILHILWKSIHLQTISDIGWSFKKMNNDTCK